MISAAAEAAALYCVVKVTAFWPTIPRAKLIALSVALCWAEDDAALRHEPAVPPLVTDVPAAGAQRAWYAARTAAAEAVSIWFLAAAAVNRGAPVAAEPPPTAGTSWAESAIAGDDGAGGDAALPRANGGSWTEASRLRRCPICGFRWI